MTYEEYEEQRDILGLTNNQVSRLSGVSTATFSQWKNGVYEPKRSTLAKIQNALDNYDPKLEVDWMIHNDKIDIALEPEKQYRAIRPRFCLDMYSVTLPIPVELSEREFSELRKATEAFAESWLRVHKKL